MWLFGVNVVRQCTFTSFRCGCAGRPRRSRLFFSRVRDNRTISTCPAVEGPETLFHGPFGCNATHKLLPMYYYIVCYLVYWAFSAWATMCRLFSISYVMTLSTALSRSAYCSLQSRTPLWVWCGVQRCCLCSVSLDVCTWELLPLRTKQCSYFCQLNWMCACCYWSETNGDEWLSFHPFRATIQWRNLQQCWGLAPRMWS